jgi:hypothetical protein
MAKITLEYNAKNSVAQRIVEIILSMNGLFKVKTFDSEQSTTVVTDKKRATTAFLDKWAGKFSIAEKETDDTRYNYLVEKYK